jgi:pimeloyl-ACP methyl ester carboxylesterase
VSGATRPATGRLEPRPLEVQAGDVTLRGEELGEGPPIALLHGLTATRRYVVHGSKALPRAGFRTLSYDARGHGESDPAPPGTGYAYPELTQDAAGLVDAVVGEGRVLLAGHSMGAHTAIAYALQHQDRVAGLVAIGPVARGIPTTEERSLAYWDALADGLEQGGVDGFIAAYDHDLDPAWRDTLLRIARQRLELHRQPEAVAQALREVPRSVPFDGIEELEFLDVPVLVVASRDEADPGHPYAIAQEWAQRLPQARLISEPPGKSPLAWQGGRLSREIAAFCEQPEVAERLPAS